tara:strand:- start:178 stop:375 length:198 start_codon:yes stop_codon:yes gene_type:complete
MHIGRIFLFFFLGFTSNQDATNFLLLGKSIDEWLVYTLIFFGLTSLGFAWVWLSENIISKQKKEM